MKVLAKTGNNGLAKVYLAETSKGNYVEFAESITPPLTKFDKWVILVSTLAGCPVSCKFCDAGGKYKGKLTAEEIFEQIDFLVKSSFHDKNIISKKFKIQFARMGEPALNPEVLSVLETLPEKYKAPGLMPSLSTVAPRAKSTHIFFQRLKEIKDKIYKDNFQLQFSIHSTDNSQRDWLIPVKKWGFEQISEYGKYFFLDGNKKIALNFAVNPNSIINPDIISKFFSPDIFLIKITPINPTINSLENRIDTSSLPNSKEYPFIEELKSAGFQVIISIGELEENLIGSNCGQLLMRYLNSKKNIDNSYKYQIEFL